MGTIRPVASELGFNFQFFTFSHFNLLFLPPCEVSAFPFLSHLLHSFLLPPPPLPPPSPKSLVGPLADLLNSLVGPLADFWESLVGALADVSKSLVGPLREHILNIYIYIYKYVYVCPRAIESNKQNKRWWLFKHCCFSLIVRPRRGLKHNHKHNAQPHNSNICYLIPHRTTILFSWSASAVEFWILLSTIF